MAAQPAYLKGQGRGRGQSRGQTIGQCWQKSSGESQISTHPVGRGQAVNASQSQQDKRSNESGTRYEKRGSHLTTGLLYLKSILEYLELCDQELMIIVNCYDDLFRPHIQKLYI